jgi:hypothetical protein
MANTRRGTFILGFVVDLGLPLYKVPSYPFYVGQTLVKIPPFPFCFTKQHKIEILMVQIVLAALVVIVVVVVVVIVVVVVVIVVAMSNRLSILA